MMPTSLIWVGRIESQGKVGVITVSRFSIFFFFSVSGGRRERWGEATPTSQLPRYPGMEKGHPVYPRCGTCAEGSAQLVSVTATGNLHRTKSKVLSRFANSNNLDIYKILQFCNVGIFHCQRECTYLASMKTGRLHRDWPKTVT